MQRRQGADDGAARLAPITLAEGLRRVDVDIARPDLLLPVWALLPLLPRHPPAVHLDRLGSLHPNRAGSLPHCRRLRARLQVVGHFFTGSLSQPAARAAVVLVDRLHLAVQYHQARRQWRGGGRDRGLGTAGRLRAATAAAAANRGAARRRPFSRRRPPGSYLPTHPCAVVGVGVRHRTLAHCHAAVALVAWAQPPLHLLKTSRHQALGNTGIPRNDLLALGRLRAAEEGDVPRAVRHSAVGSGD